MTPKMANEAIGKAPGVRHVDLAPATRDFLVLSQEPPPPLLLLSRDLHFDGRDLHLAQSKTVVGNAIQKVLPGIDPPLTRITRTGHLRISSQDRLPAGDDHHMRTYLCRLSAHGAAEQGIGAYRYQLRATIRAASRLRGSSITLSNLFCDVPLLGRAIVDDTSTEWSQLSKWTLAQRRSAVRSFASVMRPELLVLLGEEPLHVVDRALRLVADRIGGGYRLTGGAPRRRGGRAPDRGETAAVLQCLEAEAGYPGLRNRAFFGILAATGCRINALRKLDGTECLVLPNGRARLYLHEKGKAERREVELSSEVAQALLEYTAAFNRLAAARWWPSRVGPGKPGAMWRNNAGRRWGYGSVLNTLKNGCAAAGVLVFTPHALRRAFASDAASLLPRHVVAQAGGWKGRDRLDDHYVQPCEAIVREKLARLDADTTLATTKTEMNNVTVDTV